MRSVPVTILAGSDRTPPRLPEGRSELHALDGYKAISLRTGGKPLLVHLVERLVGVPGFGPVSVAGPSRLYAPLELDASLIDTDGSVSVNLRRAIEHHGSSSDAPLAILACDVLPARAELARLRELYESAAPCSLWLPFVRVPADPSVLGAFAWKPTYRLRPGPGREPVRILPGHLAIFEPRALRLPLLYRLLALVYRTRNRTVEERRRVMLRSTLLALLARDLCGLSRLRAPILTASVVSSGLRLARALREDTLTLGELERLIGRMFTRRDRARGAGERGILFPLVDEISLAEDVDTQEEARQFEGSS